MDSKEIMLEKLWNYIDGIESAEEKSQIETMISTNLEWRQTYHELLGIHQSILAQPLDVPSLRFSKNVMDKIAKQHIAPATRSYLNSNIIWGIAIFFITVLVGPIFYSLTHIHWGNQSSTDEVSQYANKIDVSRYFSNSYTSIFILVGVVVGLGLLDAFLLRKKRISS
jgi:hypothetical protein